MKIHSSLFLVALTAFLTGCITPPQLPLPLSPKAFAAPASTYGIVMTSLPVVDTHFPGADCLLCMAAASVANSSLTTYTKTLQYEDFAKLNADVADALRKRGAVVKMIDATEIGTLPDNKNAQPNFTRKDFTSLKAKHKIDKLLVINVTLAGIQRNYAAYVPVSDPKARIAGVTYIVDLNDNAYDWYMPLDVQKASDGQWDEPPKFPGLTNAYFQTLELTRDQVVKPLVQ